ncbi:MAG TPA: cytochrome c, partial [Gemmatimonadales bacterium]|nr:cytochrome c [Gemmatimonadales bacterium]
MAVLQAQGGPAQAPTVRRVASTAVLAAQEYRSGIRNGRVVAPAEVEEAKLFLSEARRSAGLLPADGNQAVIASIDSLLGLVGATALPDSLDARVQRFTAALASRFGVSLVDVPATAPSLARGAKVYQENCAGCHGSAGRGDGPLAAGLEPKPANLTDAAALSGASPLDFYRRIAIGVAGTAMPAFETRLSAQDRWAA